MDKSSIYRARETAGLVVRGLAIGTADLVPGVSGGTVALVTGIYGRLVTAIGTGALSAGRLIRGDPGGAVRAFRRIDWRFLLAVVAGAVVSVAALARVVEDLLRDHPVRIAAVFFGLIAGAIVVAWWQIRTPGVVHGAMAAIVGAAAFVLFGLRGAAVHDPGWYVFAAAGALAICAFILPGVSGSFLLLAIGMYQHALGAVTDLRIGALLSLAAGAAAGLGLFSRLLEWLLERYHDLVVATMIGLMAGSFRILWPWPNGLGDEDGIGATMLGTPGPDIVVPVTLALVSCLVVVGFATWAEGSAARNQDG